MGGRKQAKSGNQHGHNDWAQSKHNSGNSSIFNRVAPHAQLVDVLEHDDSGLNLDPKKSKEQAIFLLNSIA
jgi:hypothetical protein